jgi:hypothetical protein
MKNERILSYQVASKLNLSELDQVSGAILGATNGCIATYQSGAMDLQYDLD